MKTCATCNESKSLEEFGKQKSSSDGLQRSCRPCTNAYQTERRQERAKLKVHKPRVDPKRRILDDGTVVKWCTRCQEEKELTEFYAHKTGSLYAHCKLCHGKLCADGEKRRGPRPYTEERRQQQREKWARNSFAYAMKAKATKYGITVEEATRLSTSPCEMCGANDPGVEGATMFIDHNHTTGAVRGGLCRRCNFYVGWRENHMEVEAAYDAYMSKYEPSPY